MADKDGSEMQKTRRCLDCTKSSPPSAVRTPRSKRTADTVGDVETSGGECTSKGKGPAGNRKKRANITRSVTTPTLPPEADSDVAIKLACRAKNARLHDQVLLSPKTTDAELQEVVQLAQPSKLVFVSIAAEKTLLLHKAPGANGRLKSILSAIAQVLCLHAQGTVVLALPTPHHVHLAPLNGRRSNKPRYCSGGRRPRSVCGVRNEGRRAFGRREDGASSWRRRSIHDSPQQQRRPRREVQVQYACDCGRHFRHCSLTDGHLTDERCLVPWG